jgi:hypothetical protein
VAAKHAAITGTTSDGSEFEIHKRNEHFLYFCVEIWVPSSRPGMTYFSEMWNPKL